ncbi:MAG: type VI secretion system protein TssA [bacterium]|nr:type VI secretion system protein TssA [bacterium]
MGKDVVESLLAETGDQPPCGPDLRYDAAYLELDTLVQTKPEEEPNWREVYARSADLLGRTKDLRLALYLALALLKTEGIPGIRDGLAVLRGLLERFWDQVHPQLDPDDNNDPLERLNIIASLSPPPESYQDPLLFKQRLREVSLCNSPRLGSFSLRDILIAEGELTPPADSKSPKPDMSVINAALEDTSTEKLKELAEVAAGAIDHTTGIEAALRAHVDAGRVPDLGAFRGILAAIRGRLGSYLAKRGVASSGAEGEAGAVKPTTEPEKEKPLSGEIRSPEDVVSALEKICQYYERHEPSSPVPLLLRRAQRLVSKSFLEIIRDLSPEARKQVENIGGVSGDAAKG